MLPGFRISRACYILRFTSRALKWHGLTSCINDNYKFTNSRDASLSSVLTRKPTHRFLLFFVLIKAPTECQRRSGFPSSARKNKKKKKKRKTLSECDWASPTDKAPLRADIMRRRLPDDEEVVGKQKEAARVRKAFSTAKKRKRPWRCYYRLYYLPCGQ